MSPQLFNINMDCVLREVNARMLSRGLCLLNDDRSGISIIYVFFFLSLSFTHSAGRLQGDLR